MAGKFILKKAADSQFVFVLKAANNETILTSERYTSKQKAEQGISAVKTNAPLDSRYDRRVSKDNKSYFVLKAANGEVVGTSETYSSTSARDNGIKSCQTNAPDASIIDET